jgi:hypothetical protein
VPLKLNLNIDWMYLQEDGVTFNRSVMKKFGFRLGEVTLFFQKRS